MVIEYAFLGWGIGIAIVSLPSILFKVIPYYLEERRKKKWCREENKRVATAMDEVSREECIRKNRTSARNKRVSEHIRESGYG